MKQPVRHGANSQTAHAIQVQHYEGPLPPPEAFAHYEQTCPGCALRILEMAEVEQRQRHIIEVSEASIKKELSKERSRGQWMAFVVALSFPALGVLLILNGYSLIGTIFGGAGLVPVVWAFLPKKK